MLYSLGYLIWIQATYFPYCSRLFLVFIKTTIYERRLVQTIGVVLQPSRIFSGMPDQYRDTQMVRVVPSLWDLGVYLRQDYCGLCGVRDMCS